MTVVDFDQNRFPCVKEGHNCYINGQMADGTKTWAFDEMEDGGLYTCVRTGGKMVIFRE